MADISITHRSDKEPNSNSEDIIMQDVESTSITTNLTTSKEEFNSQSRQAAKRKMSQDINIEESTTHKDKIDPFDFISPYSMKNIENRKKKFSDIPDRIYRLLENKYSSNHLGPYEIHIERIINIDKTFENKTMSESTFGRKINSQLKELWNGKAAMLRNLGCAKYSVEFPEGNMANLFIEALINVRDKIVDGQSWVAYIPNFKILRTMTTTDFDIGETPEEIMENLSPPPGWKGTWNKPIAVRNIRRPNIDPNNSNVVSYINTKRFVLVFSCFEPPRWGVGLCSPTK
jgi:hypothetical protein